MRNILIYSSKHGRTKKVVEAFLSRFKINSHNVAEGNIDLNDYDLILIFSPTYGDGEVEEQMEDFLMDLDVHNKKFAVCELGNYYGYDDYEFGAAKIIITHLKSLKWEIIYPTLSLDSMPTINWPAFDAWKEGLKCLIELS
jgi:flavodoxin I